MLAETGCKEPKLFASAKGFMLGQKKQSAKGVENQLFRLLFALCSFALFIYGWF
ncbi:MAG: hypothetical protein IPL27_08115 [Lewinellaceae bacterium]|nr:hypothetical protein [Lewinellaceae bacterium]